ncbi:MAG: radical SAM protein, partial [Clostridiales bacterium]|nr:radical SAM protein [Clostridiales bacterium]
MLIRISGIVNDSAVDGPGLRLTVFAQGCKHGCYGCHNPQTHDLNGGYFIDTGEIVDKIRKNPLLDGVTFSGGEPFLQVKEFTQLAQSIRQTGLKLNIMAYTGYTWEELILNP